MKPISNRITVRIRENDTKYYSTSSKLAARTMSAISEAAVDDGDYDAALDIMDDPRFSVFEDL